MDPVYQREVLGAHKTVINGVSIQPYPPSDFKLSGGNISVIASIFKSYTQYWSEDYCVFRNNYYQPIREFLFVCDLGFQQPIEVYQKLLLKILQEV